MSKRNKKLQKLEEITYLYEIAKSLSETIDLKKSLYSVLEILSKSLGMRRGTITILNPLRDEIQIQVAHGLSPNAMQRGKYKPGEGITGRVIQQGKAFVVSRRDPCDGAEGDGHNCQQRSAKGLPLPADEPRKG